MGVFGIAIGAVLVLGSVLIFLLKIPIAYSQCSGAAPLFDGLIFPPVFIAFGMMLVARRFGVNPNTVLLAAGLVSFAVCGLVYSAAWAMGGRRNR